MKGNVGVDEQMIMIQCQIEKDGGAGTGARGVNLHATFMCNTIYNGLEKW